MRRERVFIAVYIVTNKERGTLYIGVTSNLYQRAQQHRDGTLKGFASKHGLTRLVWFEPFEDMHGAIHREKSAEAIPPPMEDQSDRTR